MRERDLGVGRDTSTSSSSANQKGRLSGNPDRVVDKYCLISDEQDFAHSGLSYLHLPKIDFGFATVLPISVVPTSKAYSIDIPYEAQLATTNRTEEVVSAIYDMHIVRMSIPHLPNPLSPVNVVPTDTSLTVPETQAQAPSESLSPRPVGLRSPSRSIGLSKSDSCGSFDLSQIDFMSH